MHCHNQTISIYNKCIHKCLIIWVKTFSILFTRICRFRNHNRLCRLTLRASLHHLGVHKARWKWDELQFIPYMRITTVFQQTLWQSIIIIFCKLWCSPQYTTKYANFDQWENSALFTEFFSEKKSIKSVAS